MLRFAHVHEFHTCIKYKVARHASKIKNVCRSFERHKSYYQALELDSTASTKDIKAAYYRLSLKFHPDKNNGSEESVVKFREITEAYEVLSNAEKKKKYDQGYGFQSNYKSKYGNTGTYYRPSNYQRPFTGRTKDFNYDEHFRQHYEYYYQKQREAEYENFRRKMEADFRRRYESRDEYYRNRQDSAETSEIFKQRLRVRQYAYAMVTALWTVMFIIATVQMYADPENHSAVYYKFNKENSESKNDHK